MDQKRNVKSKLTDFEILNKLGMGSFGIVYKVKRKGKLIAFINKPQKMERFVFLSKLTLAR